MGQLSGIGEVICRELEPGVRNPEGDWGWIGKKRRELKSLGRNLANREVRNYFKECSLVKSPKLSGLVEKHRQSLEFTGDLAGPDSEVFQENFQNI